MSETNGRKPPKKPLNDYARYSGMAVQMGVIIALGAWGGTKLDAYFGFKTPVITLVLTLLSVFIAIYLSIKDFIKKK